LPKLSAVPGTRSGPDGKSEIYVKVAGSWRYVYRAMDEDGQVIDVYVSPRRDSGAARRFFHRALATAVVAPVEVVTDQAACYLRVLDEVVPQAWHRIERYANNRIEADHAQLKRRLRPMRGLKTDVSARTVIAGHAFIQNIRRGHYELAADAPPKLRSRRPSMNSLKQFDPIPASDSMATAIGQRNKALAAPWVVVVASYLVSAAAPTLKAAFGGVTTPCPLNDGAAPGSSGSEAGWPVARSGPGSCGG
jgi:hypothetical protein